MTNSTGIGTTRELNGRAKISSPMNSRTTSGQNAVPASVACCSEAMCVGNFMEDSMQNSSGMHGGRSNLDAWLAIRRWSITGSGNLRRMVNTPGHTFVVAEMPEEVRALYKSDEDGK